MFSFAFEQMKCFEEIDNKAPKANIQMGVIMRELFRKLIMKLIYPRRLSGMQFFMDFDD